MMVGPPPHPFRCIEPRQIGGSEVMELIQEAPELISPYSLEADSLSRLYHATSILRTLDEDPSRVPIEDLLMPEILDLTKRALLARKSVGKRERVHLEWEGIQDVLQLNIPAILRDGIVGLEVGAKSGDFISFQTSKDYRTRAGLVVDAVTDPNFPGLDKALALELEKIFPTLLAETDEVLPWTHKWAHIHDDHYRTRTMNNVLQLHKRLLEAKDSVDKPYYKGTGAYWVDTPEGLILNYWGDVRVAIVAREKRVGKPKIIFSNQANTSYDAATITLAAIAASPFIGLGDKVTSQILTQQYIGSSYAVKYNGWNPDTSVGVIGYPGNFAVNVGSVKIERTDGFDMLPIVYSDGFETLAKVLGVHPVNLALYIADHSSRAVNSAEWNSPLVDILLSPAITIFHGEGFPVGTETRTHTDDASLQIIDSPYNHGAVWSHSVNNQLRDTLTRLRGDQFLLREAAKAREFLLSRILER